MIATLREWRRKLKIQPCKKNKAEIYEAGGKFIEIYDWNGMALSHCDFRRKQNKLFIMSCGALMEACEDGEIAAAR